MVRDNQENSHQSARTKRAPVRFLDTVQAQQTLNQHGRTLAKYSTILIGYHANSWYEVTHVLKNCVIKNFSIVTYSYVSYDSFGGYSWFEGQSLPYLPCCPDRTTLHRRYGHGATKGLTYTMPLPIPISCVRAAGWGGGEYNFLTLHIQFSIIIDSK